MEANTAEAWAPTGMQRAYAVCLLWTKAPLCPKKSPVRGLFAYEKFKG